MNSLFLSSEVIRGPFLNSERLYCKAIGANPNVTVHRIQVTEAERRVRMMESYHETLSVLVKSENMALKSIINPTNENKIFLNHD